MSGRKRILIVHYRVGMTDGVSLEIANWKEILERQGHIVRLASGPINKGADYVVTELENQINPTVFAIDEQAFGGEAAYEGAELISVIKRQRVSIKRDFERIISECHPERIIISNIFSVGENIAAAQPILEVLDTYQTPTLLVHHDFYWENVRYKQPAYAFVDDILNEYFTPQRNYVTHACINTIGKKALQKKCGIDATLLYDTLDFDQDPWSIDEYNGDILTNWKIKPRDIILLQATRIVRRKNIELAIDYCNELEWYFAQRSKNETVVLYDGNVYDPDESKLYLVLAGYAEKRDHEYFKELLHYAALQKVNLCYIGDRIGQTRQQHEDGKKYSLWDAYAACDMITYPSEYEGFGNQLLEALFAKKPVVAFEYPVFLTDIKPKGVHVVSLGDTLGEKSEGDLVSIPLAQMHRAVREGYDVLTDSDHYSEQTDANFSVAKRYFSFDTTARVLNTLLGL